MKQSDLSNHVYEPLNSKNRKTGLYFRQSDQMSKRTHENISENSPYAPTFLGCTSDVAPYIFEHIGLTTYIALHFVDKTSFKLLQTYKNFFDTLKKTKFSQSVHLIRRETIRANITFYQWLNSGILWEGYGRHALDAPKLLEYVYEKKANVELVKHLVQKSKLGNTTISKFMALASLNRSRKIFDVLHEYALSKDNTFSMVDHHIRAKNIGLEFTQVVSTGNLEFVKIFFQNSVIEWDKREDELKKHILEVVIQCTGNVEIFKYVKGIIGDCKSKYDEIEIKFMLQRAISRKSVEWVKIILDLTKVEPLNLDLLNIVKNPTDEIVDTLLKHDDLLIIVKGMAKPLRPAVMQALTDTQELLKRCIEESSDPMPRCTSWLNKVNEVITTVS